MPRHLSVCQLPGVPLVYWTGGRAYIDTVPFLFQGLRHARYYSGGKFFLISEQDKLR